ncbi:MAG: NAD(P)/FAD-dependent oxidoreductase [Bacteroidetes bacterium]|nr:NAD(P)/FAD-dependent oxidoreductase [Bacteroidota bacterium]
MSKQKIAIIGAGAAGCFAAANIPFAKDREVTVFEKTGKVMQKVKVSGGGRCNTTHSCFDVDELITRYPRGKQFLKKTLYRFSPQETIAWFKERGVLLKTEEDGRMFPVTDDSQTIIDAVWQQMMRNKVSVLYHKSLDRIEKRDEGFELHFADGNTYIADKVLITCGGFPKAEQYHWLKTLGHTIQSPVPSLFTFNIPKHPITALMGVAVQGVTVKIAGTKIAERGPLLITHWGFSGPVVLRTSAWAARELNERNYEFTAIINWLGETTEADLKEIITDLRKEQGKQVLSGKNPFELPRRFWEYQLEQCGIGADVRWGDLPAAAQNKLITALVRDNYDVKGKTTFKEEFVTCGGIKLSEVDPQTMESRVLPGLYFAGEIMDVDGITGGFNFQHAWSSGYIAAQSIIA